MDSEGREVRIGEGQRGLSSFSCQPWNIYLKSASSGKVEMSSKILEMCTVSHSKNSHGLETEIYIFVFGFFKCLITN